MPRFPDSIDSPAAEHQAMEYFLVRYKPVLDQFGEDMNREVRATLAASIRHQRDIQGDPEQFLRVMQIYLLGVLPRCTQAG